MHGSFRYGNRNQGDEKILNFAIVYDLIKANTFLRMRQSHLVSFNSGQHSSQIDFNLIRRDDKRADVDCKVIPEEYVVLQHQFLISKFRLRILVRRDKKAKISRTK